MRRSHWSSYPHISLFPRLICRSFVVLQWDHQTRRKLQWAHRMIIRSQSSLIHLINNALIVDWLANPQPFRSWFATCSDLLRCTIEILFIHQMRHYVFYRSDEARNSKICGSSRVVQVKWVRLDSELWIRQARKFSSVYYESSHLMSARWVYLACGLWWKTFEASMVRLTALDSRWQQATLKLWIVTSDSHKCCMS